eukprot:TRINITY_DN4419_c1_g1_i1.p1 TRINITY_DN4419_c1_g1~~TRINITY_DN4419_c1_g1_i1.p1  ORF type:complete len:1166 (-),score=413.58 TRINITY_DN4419_c1_g1_i1:31-3102(-)
MYGEVVNENTTEFEEGNSQLGFARFLSLLHDLSQFVNRVYAVVKNVIQQLASLYNAQQKLYATTFKNVHLQTVFGHLSDLLGTLITLDEIIQSNSGYANQLNMYKRMVKDIKLDTARYNADEEKLWQMEKMLFSLKGQLLDGRIFQNCIEQEFDAVGLIDVTQNAIFKQQFMSNVRVLHAYLNDKTRSPSETNQRYRVVGLCGLYTFFIAIFKDPSDKKFFKALFDLHKKVPCVLLYGDVVWFMPEFFRAKVPVAVRLIGNPDSTGFLRAYVKQLDAEFHTNVRAMYLQVSLWMVRMESNLRNRFGGIGDILEKRREFMQLGLVYAYQLGNMFKEVVSLHLSLNVPLKTGHIRYLCQCIEMIKAIQAAFHRRNAILGESISFMIHQYAQSIQKTFIPIRGRLESGKKYSDGKLDVLAAVNLAMQMLHGCATKERRLLLKISTQVIFQMDFLKEEEVQSIKESLEKLDSICDFQEQLYIACDCHFMFWSRSMLPGYLNDIYEHTQQVNKLQYMFAGLRDIIPVFKKIVHQDPSAYLDGYRDELQALLQKHIIDPLCKDIQTDLLFHIHSHLEVSDRNPMKNGVKDLGRLLKIKPLRSVDRNIDIKAHVTHFLDTTFYNLTTVSLNNWKTYGEMRNLAQEKYGLKMIEAHLPGQTLEQGIDVLEIMRNIHIFVQKYYYNLNNQIFVEKSSENKMLNTINIQHVANSIRTHGIGIMNTTVNFIFQFLKQKFVVFSQFLYDDHIKSPLYREIRFFKESREQLNNRYPYDRAAKFNKEIKKLGLTESKQSYLDQFRILITEIGNAMGYIRMIRSGGFSYVSNAIKFVPDLQDILPFEGLCRKDGLSEETSEAARNLDGSIDSLAKNFAGGTEYFKMLVSVFAEHFRSAQNIHMKNFFIIIPALTINFVEHILTGKEKVTKRKPGGFFTDDGFVIGVAYILKLIDQNKQFDALHWFDEVRNHYQQEIRKLQADTAKLKKEEQETIVLTSKKLQSYQLEFELLRFTFDGARIFFNDRSTQQQEQPAALNT